MSATEYRLRMPEPHTHLFEVEVRVPEGNGPVDLVMPSWTPGSYLLREFPKQVQGFRAYGDGGRELPWSKVDKNTWRVEARSGETVRVGYRVYAHELTVRTSHLDASHALVNGASIFMYVRGREKREHRVSVEPPKGWKIATTLPAGNLVRAPSAGHSEGAPSRGDSEGATRPKDPRPYLSHEFVARDYHHLVDSPMEIGHHELLEWEQSGKRHRWAIWGRGNYDGARLVEDTRKIIAAAEAMFGGLPYEEYLFIVHLCPDGRGGLEHADSTVLQADRWAFDGEAYENFLALVAHEFFHVWNAKRIRPESLVDPDYTRENYTRSLWVVEGLTTYYTDLMLRRAGLISDERYLARLAESIARWESIPGRREQTLADSSFDTWIRFYRPDEQTPNAQISYYHKGALLGLILDLKIRDLSGNERSLDEVMLALWERYGRTGIGFPEDGDGGVEALVAEIAGGDAADWQAFFDRYLRRTEELELEEALEVAGVWIDRRGGTDEASEESGERVRGVAAGAAGATPAAVIAAEAETDRGEKSGAASAAGLDGPPPPAAGSADLDKPSDAAVLAARLGVRVRDRAGRLHISWVVAEGPAWEAGAAAGDEVVALDELRIRTAAELAARVRDCPAGAEAILTVFRRDELTSVRVQAGEAPVPKPRLVRREESSEAQREVYDGWIGEGAVVSSASSEARAGAAAG